MIKNNKGISIVEIIISVALISIILILLLSVLITVRSENEREKVLSTLLMNQAILTKEIESDFIDIGLIGIASCNDGPAGGDTVLSIIPGSATSFRNRTKGNCLKLIFNSSKTSDNIGYLLSYNYGFSSTEQINVVGYRRGEKKVLRETPNLYDGYGTVKNSCVSTTCSLKIDLPILNDAGEDYGLHLSYIYKSDPGIIISGFTSYTTDYNFKIDD